MMFDKELMKQLTTIPAEDRAKWFEERDKLEQLASEMNRLNVKEMVPKYGIARGDPGAGGYNQARTAGLRCGCGGDGQFGVPPVRAGRDAEMWFCSTIHRAYVQDLFRQYANLASCEKGA